MQDQDGTYSLATLIVGTVLVLVLVTYIVIVFLTHKAARRKHLQEIQEKENQYRQEILKAQLEVKEQTLRSVSEELHDNIGQVMSLVKLNLATLPKDSEKSQKKLEETRGLVKQLSEDLRHMSRLLHPEHGSDLLLEDVLRNELYKLEQSGLYKTKVHLEGEERKLPPNVHILVYRMIQEILNNIIKHAQANQVEAHIVADDRNLTLRISDNGVGCNPETWNDNPLRKSGMGIGNLKYRASLIGAEIVFESEKNKGTTVSLVLTF